MTFRRTLITLVFLIIPSMAHAQGVVTGHILLPSGAPPANGKICASLQNFKPQVPHVVGVGTIVSQTNFCVSSSPTDGSFSLPIHLNSAILPAQTFWRFDFMVNGIQQSSATYNVNVSPFNLDTAAPTVVFPGPSTFLLGAHTFEFAQSTPALTWVIAHNFGDRNVVFNCYDSGNKFLEPDTVIETDQNTLTLTFVVPQAGQCTVMNGGNVALTNAPANAVVTNPNAAQTVNLPFSLTGPFNANAGGSLSGVFLGPTLMGSLNSTLYVGGAFGTTDIGAQINAAYTALPSSGGDIIVTPQAGGGCYLYLTPIVMATPGKYARVRAAAPASSASGVTTGGACIQYQHTTATAAVTYDPTPAAGGSYVGGEAWQDVTIKNSATEGGTTPCSTNGGCGSLATGIKIGGTNGGAQMANWANLAIEGFGVGIDSSGSLGIGWAMNFYNLSLAYNNIGHQSDGTEGDNFFGGSISVNGTGVKFIAGGAGGGNKKFFGVHFDSNTVLGIDGTAAGTAGIVECHGCHFENLGTTNVAYVNLAGGAGQLDIFGGEALDDNTSGSAAPYWFTANFMDVEGLLIFQNAGTRPVPTSLFSIITAGYVKVVNNSPSVLTGNLGLAQWPHKILGPGLAQEDGISHLQGTQVGATGAAWNAGSGTGGALTCTVAGVDTIGQITCLTGSNGGTPAASGAIQLNFYKAYTGTSSTCLFMPADVSGGGTWPLGTAVKELPSPTNNTYLIGWATNGAALSTSTNYSLNYVCGGR